MNNDQIYEIIEKYDGSGEIEECSEELDALLSSSEDVVLFEINEDTDVFYSCGLDIFYVSVAWTDKNGNLHLCGSRLTSH